MPPQLEMNLVTFNPNFRFFQHHESRGITLLFTFKLNPSLVCQRRPEIGPPGSYINLRTRSLTNWHGIVPAPTPKSKNVARLNYQKKEDQNLAE